MIQINRFYKRLLLLLFLSVFLILPGIRTLALDNNRWYRKSITIDHSFVASTLVDFPVLVKLDADSDLAADAQDDGDDILFTDHSNNLLAYEIEYFNGSTGDLVAWVEVPSLSADFDTTLFLYYGNSDASSQENSEEVWDSNYMMVQHFNETSGIHFDSTSNMNNGTAIDGAVQDAVGKIDGADGFDGSDDHVEVPDSISLPTISTIELWFKPAVTYDSSYDSGYDGLISKREDSGEFGGFAWFFYGGSNSANRGRIQLTNDPGSGTNTSILTNNRTWTLNNWYYVVLVLDGVSGKVFVNGIDNTETSTVSASSLMSTIEPLVVAKQISGSLSYFNGVIDEVRISNSSRSDSWILTSYNNQNSPSAFYSVGLEEDSPRPVVSNPSPTDGETGVDVGISNLSFDLTDGQSDLIDYAVTSIPDVIGGTQSGTGASSGTRIDIPIIGTLEYKTSYSWQVEASDPSGSNETTIASYTFTTGGRALVDWSDREELTIDHTQVAGELVDFPVLIDITLTGLVGTAQLDGDDILFTDSTADWGTDPASVRLDHEIEFYDSTSGHLVAWVNVPDLSSITDTTLYIYYGNNDAENQQYSEGVWDSNYVMVQHLEETAGLHLDSTRSDNDGTAIDGVIQDAVGQIDGADDFDGLDDHLEVIDSESLSDVSTIELWFNPAITYDNTYGSGGSEYDGFISKREAGGEYTGYAWFFYGGSTTPEKRGKIQLTNDPGLPDTSIIVSNRNEWTAGEWYYIVVVLDGVSGEVYVNGVNDTDSTYTTETGATLTPTSESLVIAKHVSSYINFFDGMIDEVRLSDTHRSADWILTSYNNQSSPSTFIKLGPPPIVTLNSPDDASSATNPVTFEFTPECYSDGGCSNAELYIEEIVYSGEGELEWSNSDLVRMDRALLRDNKAFVLHWPISNPQVNTIMVFDFLTGSLIEESPVFGDDNSSTAPTLDPTDDEIVYGVSGDGVIVKYNWITDSIIWETDVGNSSGQIFWPSFVPYYNGYLYLAFRDYEIVRVDASTGDVVDSIQMATGTGDMQIPPRLDSDEGVLYIQDATHLTKVNALDLEAEIIWSQPTGSNCLAVSTGSRFVPLLVEDTFTGGEKWIITHCAADMTLYAFDSDGNQEWIQTLDRPVRAPPSYHPDRGWIYLNSYATSNGEMYVLDITDGTSEFDILYPNGYPSYRPVMLTKDYVISKTDRGGSTTDYLYVFDNTTGDVVGTINIGTQYYLCDPLITSGGYTLITHAYDDSVRLYELGAGEFSDYYSEYLGTDGYQYTENGLTDYGQPSLVWTSIKTSEDPINSGVLNSIDYDFSSYDLPDDFNWDIKVTDAVGNSSFAESYRTVTVELPTNVILPLFTAEEQNGFILLSWNTSNEIDLLGFNLYRSDGFTLDQVILNTNMIQALSPGSLGGNIYSYRDALVEPGKEYSYWLEVVSTSGSTTVGPVTATAPYVIFTPMLIR